MKTENIKCSIPEYAVYYLAYNSDDSLSVDDIKNINDWLKSLPHQYIGITIAEDSEKYFCGFPEFGLPCDCYDCTITMKVK